MCDVVSHEVSNILKLSYEWKWKLKCRRLKKEAKAVHEFCAFVQEHGPGFSAAGFFKVDKSTIPNVLATVVTFFIVMIQFQQTEKHY